MNTDPTIIFERSAAALVAVAEANVKRAQDALAAAREVHLQALRSVQRARR